MWNSYESLKRIQWSIVLCNVDIVIFIWASPYIDWFTLVWSILVLVVVFFFVGVNIFLSFLFHYSLFLSVVLLPGINLWSMCEHNHTYSLAQYHIYAYTVTKKKHPFLMIVCCIVSHQRLFVCCICYTPRVCVIFSSSTTTTKTVSAILTRTPAQFVN